MTEPSTAVAPERVPSDATVILRTVVGSRAYGVDTPSSDVDIAQVAVEGPGAVIGLDQHFKSITERDAAKGQRATAGDTETATHELRHFCRLAAQGNPNLLDPLFASEMSVLDADPVGRQLRDLRHSFLHVGTIHRFLGYATSQRARLLGRGTHQSRMPKRPELVEAHGYDTKYAGHMVRLVMQADELAQHGTLTMPLEPGNRDFVLAVRAGEVSQAQTLATFDQIEAAVRTRLDARLTPLPKHADSEAISAWLVAVHHDVWSR